MGMHFCEIDCSPWEFQKKWLLSNMFGKFTVLVSASWRFQDPTTNVLQNILGFPHNLFGLGLAEQQNNPLWKSILATENIF